MSENISTETTLKAGQTWHPKNGDPLRQIVEVRAARLGDKLPMGTLLVCWAVNMDRWGVCSARSFKSWIKRTEAGVHA